VTTTYTASQTSTFSEARARAVMRHVLGDFMNTASTGLIARETIQRWHEEVEYAVIHQVVDTFQLQFTKPDGTRLGLSYTIRDDGTNLGGFKGRRARPPRLPSRDPGWSPSHVPAWGIEPREGASLSSGPRLDDRRQPARRHNEPGSSLLQRRLRHRA